MKVKDIMTPNVECASPDDTVQEAAYAMKALNIGLLPVCDGDCLAGMLTDRDIAIRAVADGRDPTLTRVGEVMTPNFICCYEYDEAEEAARLMQDRRVRRVLVLDSNKQLVGVVSLGDLASAIDDPHRVGKVFRTVTEPTLADS
jgi:CBS domain-containing protein